MAYNGLKLIWNATLKSVMELQLKASLEKQLKQDFVFLSFINLHVQVLHPDMSYAIKVPPLKSYLASKLSGDLLIWIYKTGFTNLIYNTYRYLAMNPH